MCAKVKLKFLLRIFMYINEKCRLSRMKCEEGMNEAVIRALPSYVGSQPSLHINNSIFLIIFNIIKTLKMTIC